MKLRIIIYIGIALFSVSCLRLDGNLFNTKVLTSYEWDNYKGEQDFVLDDSYKIPADKMFPFTLKSQMSSESKASTLYAVYIGDTARIKTDTVILYCHGNKWHMDYYWQRAKLLAHVGGKNRYGVLMLDYRGYGMSEGKSTEASLYHDVDMALLWLKDRGLEGQRLVMYGFSMGTFPACELAAKPRSLSPHKLIFEAPYASAAAMVGDASGVALPSSYVTDLKIDNAEKIKIVTQSLLWLHGSQDHYCQLETQGQIVYDNHKGEKYKLIAEGADHDYVPLVLGFDNYIKALEAFMKRP